MMMSSRGGLTQLWGFAQDKCIGPELADGGAVEAVVAHGAPEALGIDDVHHVEACPQSSQDTAGGTNAL